MSFLKLDKKKIYKCKLMGGGQSCSADRSEEKKSMEDEKNKESKAPEKMDSKKKPQREQIVLEDPILDEIYQQINDFNVLKFVKTENNTFSLNLLESNLPVIQGLKIQDVVNYYYAQQTFLNITENAASRFLQQTPLILLSSKLISESKNNSAQLEKQQIENYFLYIPKQIPSIEKTHPSYQSFETYQDLNNKINNIQQQNRYENKNSVIQDIQNFKFYSESIFYGGQILRQLNQQILSIVDVKSNMNFVLCKNQNYDLFNTIIDQISKNQALKECFLPIDDVVEKEQSVVFNYGDYNLERLALLKQKKGIPLQIQEIIYCFKTAATLLQTATENNLNFVNIQCSSFILSKKLGLDGRCQGYQLTIAGTTNAFMKTKNQQSNEGFSKLLRSIAFLDKSIITKFDSDVPLTNDDLIQSQLYSLGRTIQQLMCISFGQMDSFWSDDVSKSIDTLLDLTKSLQDEQQVLLILKKILVQKGFKNFKQLVQEIDQVETDLCTQKGAQKCAQIKQDLLVIEAAAKYLMKKNSNIQIQKEETLQKQLFIYQEYGMLFQQIAVLSELLKLAETKQNNDSEIYKVSLILGDLYWNLGKQNDSLGVYEKNLNIKNRPANEDKGQLINRYLRTGGLFWNQGKHDKALQNYQECLRLQLTKYKENDIELAKTYLNIGIVEWNKGLYDKALENQNKALSIQVSNLGAEHIELAKTYLSLGTVYTSLQKFDKASENYEKCLKMQKVAYGDDHLELAKTYLNIGMMLNEQGKTSMAMQKFEECLALQIKYLGDNSYVLANTYLNIGLLCKNLGNNDKAMENYEKRVALQVNIYGEDYSELSITHLRIGGIYWNKGIYDKACLNYEKCLKLQLLHFGENDPILINTYLNLGIVFRKQNKLISSLFNYEKALKLQIDQYGEDNINLAKTYLGISVVLQNQLKFDKALEALEKCMNLQIKNYGEKSIELTRTYLDFGSTYYNWKKFDKSIQNYEKCLELQLSLDGQNKQDISDTYLNIGIAYDDFGKPDKALENYQKCLALQISHYGEKNIQLANTYYNIGLIYMGKKNLDEAMNNLTKCLQLQEAKYGQKNPELSKVLTSMLEIYKQKGDSQKEKEIESRLKEIQ